jgi:hypothetical protein
LKKNVVGSCPTTRRKGEGSREKERGMIHIIKLNVTEPGMLDIVDLADNGRQ